MKETMGAEGILSSKNHTKPEKELQRMVPVEPNRPHKPSEGCTTVSTHSSSIPACAFHSSAQIQGLGGGG